MKLLSATISWVNIKAQLSAIPILLMKIHIHSQHGTTWAIRIQNWKILTKRFGPTIIVS